MGLLDLHYDLEELYDSIAKEKSILNSLDKSCIPLGLDIHDEKAAQLGKRARNIGNSLEEVIGLSREVSGSLGKPYDFSVKSDALPEYAPQVRRLVGNTDSLPISQFEAAGILETYELGGLRRVRESVDELDSNLKILRIKSTRSMNIAQIVILLAFLTVFLVIIWLSNTDISWIADILQIVTFILALFLLIVSIGAVRILEAISSVRKAIGHKLKRKSAN